MSHIFEPTAAARNRSVYSAGNEPELSVNLCDYLACPAKKSHSLADVVLTTGASGGYHISCLYAGTPALEPISVAPHPDGTAPVPLQSWRDFWVNTPMGRNKTPYRAFLRQATLSQAGLNAPRVRRTVRGAAEVAFTLPVREFYKGMPVTDYRRRTSLQFFRNALEVLARACPHLPVFTVHEVPTAWGKYVYLFRSFTENYDAVVSQANLKKFLTAVFQVAGVLRYLYTILPGQSAANLLKKNPPPLLRLLSSEADGVEDVLDDMMWSGFHDCDL